ncbi:glycosyltransferase [Algoriphagus halophytocola]|uniref:Glycosyltransferase n=1 Tax=Algoriphagus halophytocola TaxID=2991499 RepID=A0ABY6MJH1_9BACT|nr:glycosyltransferase [Algoriphagus sp. TR-M5]UZD23931.1 glycosyltransferase [Algoriphagus sp. TR-M5]
MSKGSPKILSTGIKGKIRVLHCIETISSGGVEKVRLNYTRIMSNDFFELKIVCTQAKGQIRSELESLGVEVIAIGTFNHPFEIRKYRKLLQVIQAFKPHIIHGAVFEGNSMAFVGKLFGGVPISILEETSDPKFRSKRANQLLGFYSRFANAVIGISPAVIEYLKNQVGVPNQKLKLIPNGVDIPMPTNPKVIQILKDKLQIREGDVVVGAVGRVYNQVKRFSDILEAMAILSLPHLKFILIGNGPDLESLKEQASSLGLQDQAHFVGYEADPNAFYGLMDVFCVPSLQEGFGLVAVEAMFHHLPVIASQVGGLKDVVQEGKTGYLIPPLSPDLMAEKIKNLIENPTLRSSMGERGKQRALENYTSERYCKEVEKLYLELLSNKKIEI